MNSGKRSRRAAWALAASLVAVTAIGAPPARAQDDAEQEFRLRKLESQVRQLQHQPPVGAVQAATPPPAEAGLPVATPLTDVLTRMDALEAAVARLTAQDEEMANHQRQIDAKLAQVLVQVAPPVPATPPASAPGAPLAAAPSPAAAAPVVARTATANNLSTMTGGASDRPADAQKPGPAHPSAQRIAAVKAVIKPQTGNAGLDEYSYGFRLYEAKFYPEAAQQLKIYLDKYPDDSHVGFARNLLGRAYLDDGKPGDAWKWFLLNYKTDQHGPRAADSLLNLAEAMRQLGETAKACIALHEFGDKFATEAHGRLRQDYAGTRGGLTCN